MSSSIKNYKKYEEILKRIYELMQKDIEPHSKESDELKSLSILVKNYEDKRFPIRRKH